MSQDTPSLEDFGGAARLFPLPNLVLYPQVVQPLHIFEPRYRQLMADALADDRLIAMALLQPGWEEDYHKTPPIHPVVCVGSILQEERLSDGRYNFLLKGLWRARVREEVKVDRPYRIARVDVVPDVPAPASLEEELWKEVGSKVRPLFSSEPKGWDQLKSLMQGKFTLGDLCDTLGFILPFDVEVKQQLLAETRVAERVQILLGSLPALMPEDESEPAKPPYPPGFSTN